MAAYQFVYAVINAAWRRFLDRAGPRALPPMTDDPDLHLIADGVRSDVSRCIGHDKIFVIPSGVRSVRIVSRDAVPAEWGIARDPRSRGVAVRRIAIRCGMKSVAIAASAPRLTEGFHGYEPADDQRWTNGDAAIPPALLPRGRRGSAEWVLTLGSGMRYPEHGLAWPGDRHRAGNRWA